MSIFDGYRREEHTRTEPGDYLVTITGVEEKVSRNGNPMLVVTVRPNGSSVKIMHYLVKNEYFNRNLTDLMDSFGIEEGNHDILTWIGAIGGAKLVEDEEGYLKVRYFLSPEKQEKLPPWEGPVPERQTVTSIPQDADEFSEDDFLF